MAGPENFEAREIDDALDEALRDIEKTKKNLEEATLLRKSTEESLEKAQDAAERLKRSR